MSTPPHPRPDFARIDPMPGDCDRPAITPPQKPTKHPGAQYIGKLFLLVLLHFILWPALPVDAAPDEISTTRAIALAEEVLAKTGHAPIATSKEVEVIFEAAQKLVAQEQYTRARSYYEKGLQLSPWNMDAQLAYARVLMEIGEVAQAQRAAQIVFQTSERQDLLEQAGPIAGMNMPSPLDILPDQKMKKKAFCFVPMGKVEPWVLARAGRRLSETLGVEVFLYKNPFKVF